MEFSIRRVCFWSERIKDSVFFFGILLRPCEKIIVLTFDAFDGNDEILGFTFFNPLIYLLPKMNKENLSVNAWYMTTNSGFF